VLQLIDSDRGGRSPYAGGKLFEKDLKALVIQMRRGGYDLAHRSLPAGLHHAGQGFRETWRQLAHNGRV
jgi:hypothetical protein